MCFSLSVKSSGVFRSSGGPGVLRLREEREPGRQLPAQSEFRGRMRVVESPRAPSPATTQALHFFAFTSQGENGRLAGDGADAITR